MRALAAFIMKGRTQAVAVSALGVGSVLFAWVGAAAAALVMLRKGESEGAFVLLWALLPAVVIAAVASDFSPLAILLGAATMAVVLRRTVSWSLSLMVAAASGVFTAVLMMGLGGAQVEAMQGLLQQLIDQMSEQAAEQGQTVSIAVPGKVAIAGIMGISNTGMVIVSLMLARWWQALLYNPGGFQQEFHGLRLTIPQVVMLLAAAMVAVSAGEGYYFWGMIFIVPLVVAGLALVHSMVARLRLGGHWLVFFYIAWLLLGPVKSLLIVAAIVDSVIDIRRRLPKRD